MAVSPASAGSWFLHSSLIALASASKACWLLSALFESTLKEIFIPSLPKPEQK
jgi:hypothetical protein